MSDSVTVVWDDGYLDYYLGGDHPLHPVRLALTISLARHLGVLDAPGVTLEAPRPAGEELLTLVHDPAYLEVVRRAPQLGPAAGHGFESTDNPVFPRMYEAAALIAGGSVLAAERVWSGTSQHAVNIAGGLHHAMRARASGFCVVNDAAVAIARLLELGAERVAYVDVDVHHGDGVQAAFYADPRVLTVSLHQTPLSLFPGTGFPDEVGRGDAAGTSVNVALPVGTTDEQWHRAFAAVVPGTLRAFRPQVLVTQAGCDTHHEDPLAELALTVDGQRSSYRALHDLAHELCGGRWVALGGGGYGLVRCVPRAWTHLLAEACGRPVAPGTPVPAAWQDEVRARGLRTTPPAAMTELDPPPQGIAWREWQPGGPGPLDRAIAATRRAVYPLNGLDPDDPATDPRAAGKGIGMEGAAYPVAWEADVVVSDGGVVHVRPMLPTDRDRLVAFHSRLSDRTVYLRYFAPHPRLSDRDLRRLTEVDHRDRVALVALLGDDLVGVGRYDRVPGTADAEVAFVVDDAQQGRGIGSMLLEHLAAAARERGIERFVAEVLAENSRMVRVFTDAGYSAAYAYNSGVVRLTFPIAPTEQSRAVAAERERRAESRSIERLLTPRSVAVVGASTDPGKVGHVVFGNLMAYGFQGPVYPVHPEARHVGGVRAYPSVLDIPDDVDLAVVAVPAAAVGGVVEQCARKRVRGLVVVSGGFGERDAEGRAREQALVREARAHGMRVVGPNCLGVVNADPAVRLNATIAPLAPGRGRVGFFAQSGALGVAILAAAARWGLGLSTFVSAGNRADVSGNDLLQFWERDPATDVVLLYLESFGNPRKFARLARRVARTKPIVAVKTGRYAAATPALAARAVPVPEERVQALFEGSGVIRVDTLTELFDVAQLLAYQPLPPGRRVATVTNSTALGVLAADACVASGLERAAASVDLGPQVDVAGFAARLRAATEQADAVVAVFAPVLATPGDDYARALAEVAAGSTVPVVSTFLGTEGVSAPLRRLGRAGEALPGSVPSYPTPERAVRALAAAARYAQWRRRPAGTVPELPGVDTGAARALVAEVLAGSPAGRELTGPESTRLLRAYALAPVPRRLAAGPEEAVAAAAELGYPVAVKATAPALRHRPDLGAVRLDLPDAAAVRAAALALAELDGGAPVVVQPMAPAGVATVVEVLDDPSFGALVSFGVGGLATELLGDRAYAPVPLSDLDAAGLVAAPRAAPLLSGYRGAEPVDTAALTDLLLRVSRLAEDLPEVLGLELNPVLAARTGLAVLSARVTVGPPTARADPGPRRL